MNIPLKPSTLGQRKRFYDHLLYKKIESFFVGMPKPQICAMDAGGDTGIIKDKRLMGYMLYCRYDELRDKIKKYIPEDVYYDRNVYADPESVLKRLRFDVWKEQELVFDIDADNIKCTCHGKSCHICIGKAYAYALKLNNELHNIFKKTRIVYSGRGFHIHVLDRKAWKLSILERQSLVKRFSRYPIDPWVSRGHINLIRMPYTLNGLVNRRAVPIRGADDFGKAIV